MSIVFVYLDSSGGCLLSQMLSKKMDVKKKIQIDIKELWYRNLFL